MAKNADVRVSNNMVVFGTKRGEVTGGWRKLHNVNLLSLSYTPNNTRVIGEEGMKWADITSRG